MAKLIISNNGENIREHNLDLSRITIGRSPENDIVLNEPVVSGEHAVIQLNEEPTITDLQSTNGTYLNGQAVKKVPLQHNDLITIGNHELRYIDEQAQDFAATVILHHDTGGSDAQQAAIQIVNGPRAGEVMPITKQRTALGKPGVQVAVIIQQGDSYQLQPVSLGAGQITTAVNGKRVGNDAVTLNFGDEIEIADARLVFIQHQS